MNEQISVRGSGSGKEAAKTQVPAAPEEHWWPPLTSLRQEVDRLFDDFTSGWPFRARAFERHPWAHLPAAFRTAAPATDVVENEKEFVITLDLPGVEDKNIEVTASDDVLTVQAEATEERKEEKENYFLSERQHGALQRAFHIPPGVDMDKIDANYEKGVLKITLPKTAEAQKKQRKIKIKAH